MHHDMVFFKQVFTYCIRNFGTINLFKIVSVGVLGLFDEAAWGKSCSVWS